MSEISFPEYTKWERIADACVHVAGLLFGIGGALFLLAKGAGALPVPDFAGILLYSIGLVAMFSASAGYNLAQSARLKGFLRRVDHAAIFVMIAGSYTPFTLTLGGNAGILLLTAVWIIALAGATLNLAHPRRFEQMSVVLYLVQGWIVVFALKPLVETLPERSLFFLFLGGVLYTCGVIFHLRESLRFHNAIWHIFVLAGAVSQYIAIREAVLI